MNKLITTGYAVPGKLLLFSLLCNLGTSLISIGQAGEPVADPETGLLSWNLHHGALELELVQRLPDQTRAFFQGRGFSPQIANDLAEACVFQTIAGNTLSPGDATAVRVELANWRIQRGQESSTVKLKEEWLQAWGNEVVSLPARIAFRWATFPTQQTFLPGDYNWGMISFDLRPGSVFDLQVIWQQDADTQSAWIRQIHCPRDS